MFVGVIVFEEVIDGVIVLVGVVVGVSPIVTEGVGV